MSSVCIRCCHFWSRESLRWPFTIGSHSSSSIINSHLSGTIRPITLTFFSGTTGPWWIYRKRGCIGCCHSWSRESLRWPFAFVWRPSSSIVNSHLSGTTEPIFLTPSSQVLLDNLYRIWHEEYVEKQDAILLISWHSTPRRDNFGIATIKFIYFFKNL